MLITEFFSVFYWLHAGRCDQRLRFRFSCRYLCLDFLGKYHFRSLVDFLFSDYWNIIDHFVMIFIMQPGDRSEFLLCRAEIHFPDFLMCDEQHAPCNDICHGSPLQVKIFPLFFFFSFFLLEFFQAKTAKRDSKLFVVCMVPIDMYQDGKGRHKEN